MTSAVGFISTRFAGVDGVSLEASKWAELLSRKGYDCFWFAGCLERPADRSFPVAEAHFAHPEIQAVNRGVFGNTVRSGAVTAAVHRLRGRLKRALRSFIGWCRPDLLIVENALSIPMNLPLGLAVTECLLETGLPAIAHHHDFAWERSRFAVNAAQDFLSSAFPPRLPELAHVVINTAAREQLALRTGLGATVIPNVMDFDRPIVASRRRSRRLRRILQLDERRTVILQPTRIVQRKGIEHAIDLVKQLDPGNCTLLISHEAGDEGFDYAEWLVNRARSDQIDLRFLSLPLSDPLQPAAGREWSLWDAYALADLVTFPSTFEGFGNALLEAIYFRRPVLINRYDIFRRDIEPLGFDLVVMDGYLTGDVVDQIRTILASPLRQRQMTERNFQTAARHFSYTRLWEELSRLLPSGGRGAERLEADGHDSSTSPDLRSRPPLNRLAV